MAVNDAVSDVPEQGAVFTFGKCKFNGNKPGKFWLKDEKVDDIACGDEHTVLKSECGKLYAFGNNSWGQLGLGHTETVDKPTRIKKLNDILALQVACGKSHTLVLTTGGSTYGFGCNIDGQTNPSDSTCTKIADPVEINVTDDNVKLLSAGADHSAALTNSGVVIVWGSCGYLKLDSQMPASLPIKDKVKLLSCGYYHTSLLTESGSVICYGEAEGGKLGIGASSEEYLGPTRIESIKEPVKMISSGHSHTFIITESGKAMSFGDGFQGQLGQGTMVMSCDEPHAVPLEQKIKHVSCGESHTAIITEDNKLLICGDGRHGKLCFDNLSNYFTFSSPKLFLDIDVLKVACGGCHTIVLARPRSRVQKESGDIHHEKLSEMEKSSNDGSEEHQEFNADSLARTRRRNKKQDNRASFHGKTVDSRSQQLPVDINHRGSSMNSDENIDQYSLQKAQDNVDRIDKQYIESKTINVRKGNSRMKTMHRSQPKMEESNNNNEETEKQFIRLKKRKNSQQKIKNDSKANSSDVVSELNNQRTKELRKSKFCSIL